MPLRFADLLFDFDYTLADSSAGAIDCANHALRQLGLSPASPEQIRRTIGLSLHATLRQLAGDGHDGQADAFSRFFIERAEQIMVDCTVLLPGISPILAELSQAGARLGIVSTKYRRRIESILQRDGLLDLFDVIVGGEDVPVHKPDPDGLLTAVDKMGAVPENALYVGDSPTDAETARRAGIPFAAVLTGVTPASAFDPYRPCDLFADLSALAGRLLGSDQ